jgi:hypothetical protein
MTWKFFNENIPSGNPGLLHKEQSQNAKIIFLNTTNLWVFTACDSAKLQIVHLAPKFNRNILMNRFDK